MHLLLRTLLLLFTSSRRPPLTVWDSSSLPLRVLPTDIDIAMHVNNGMYFSLMDLGRFDLMVRSGVWKRMRRRGWNPVAAGGDHRLSEVPAAVAAVHHRNEDHRPGCQSHLL